MGSRTSPQDNRVPLPLKLQTIAYKIPPVPVPIPSSEDIPGVGPEKFPMSLKTGSKPALKMRPEGESMNVVEPVVAELSQLAMCLNTGGGKMKSVIPKKRKLVKTMMYHSIKNFVKFFFRPKPSAGASP